MRLLRWIGLAAVTLLLIGLNGWSQNPDVIKHMRAGVQARGEQRWDDAAREFEAAIQLAPDLAEAYANLGLVRQQQGNLSAAATAFEQALKLKPGLPGISGFLGFSYLMTGRAEAAVGLLEKARGEAPSNTRIRGWLGLAYLETSQHRRAVTELEAVRKADPQDINVLLYLARAYEAVLGTLHDRLYRLDPVKAREVEPEPGEREPESSGAVANAARIPELETSLEKNPSDVQALAELSLAYQEILRNLRAEIRQIDPEKAAAALGPGTAAATAKVTAEDAPALSLAERERLTREECSQCHRFPPPSILPKRAWLGKIGKMYSLANVILLKSLNRPMRKLPMDDAVAYYEALAPEDLNTPAWGPGLPHPTVRFERRSLAASAAGNGVPGSGNVRLVELFGDIEGPELVVCDMFSGAVSWTDPKDAKSGLQQLARLAAPDHAETVDLDKDGRIDLLVAELGQLIPSDKRLGAVTWLRNTGEKNFEVIRLARNLGRVADAQAADFDGDGDLDVVAAVFGWITVGRILYLENTSKPNGGTPVFEARTLDERVGSIHVPVVDLNKDGKPDFIALISQHHETIEAFLNLGGGLFERKEIFVAEHPHWGFSGIQPVDFDGDGDLDILYTNGDTMDDMIRFKPYQGIAWLENGGSFPFTHHQISRYYGAMRAAAGDLDGDGDVDVAASVWLPELGEAERRKHGLPGLAWFEQTSDSGFVPHVISESGCDRPTLEVGDFDGDGLPDIITGTAWLGEPPAGTEPVAVDLWRQVPRPAAR